MPRPNFSPKFRLYGDWLKASPRNTKYAQEIIRKHKLFPDRNMEFLNSLKISDVDISKKPISSLKAGEMDKRYGSLKVLKNMRKTGGTFSKCFKSAKNDMYNVTSEKEARKHLGNSIFKKGGKWVARKTDKIEVKMRIYSNGKEEDIITKSNKDRTKIGNYFHDIWRLKRGEIDEKTFKKRYGKTIIKDANGKKWKLEINRKAIEDIELADPGAIYRVIYAT